MQRTMEALSVFDPFASPHGEPTSAQAHRYILLDVFTDTPLEGNQLAVFTDGRDLSSSQMQRVARELNISETVFALEPEKGGDVRIRIFTPRGELPFAGHPALGFAVVAASALGADKLTLETQAGAVVVRLRCEGGRVVSGWMQQPIPTWDAFEHERALLAALGIARSGLPVEVYCNGPRHAYVELAGEDEVAALAPDMRSLAELGDLGANCFAGSGRHWKTRAFLPALGVPEDPATGSAAGPLAVHLSRHGRIAFGDEIEIRQGEEIGRPSLLYAFAAGSPERIESVEVGGSAVILACGELSLPG